MGRRSRSKSPRRERRRSRSRERERRARRSRSPEYSRRRRSRSPRRRSRSPERERDRGRYDRRDRSRSASPKILPNQIYQRPPLDASAFEGKSEEEIEMMKLMGFGGFDTTKGKQVPGNDVGSANITHKRRYRQYMNRRGGFNRPLDAIA